MGRRTHSSTDKRNRANRIATRLIGAGLLLCVLPLVLGRSAFLAVTLGWFLVVVGIAMLMWRRFRAHHSAPSVLMPVDKVFAEMDEALGAAKQQRRSAPQAPTAWGKEVFDVIEWRRFEALVEALFAQAGFETKSQSHGADEGIDIWLYSRSSPGAPISIVQCKHWQGKKVGVDKVRELRGVMAAKNVSRGQFATTSTFTDEAAAFARDNGVNLLDVQGLLALIAKRTPEQQTALLNVALEGEYWRPTCVNCGVKMIERTPRKGGRPFWGCTGYPRCKNIMQLRAA